MFLNTCVPKHICGGQRTICGLFFFSYLLSHLTDQDFYILEKDIKYCFCFFLKLQILSLFFIVMLSLYFWMSVKQCITLCFVFEISNVILILDNDNVSEKCSYIHSYIYTYAHRHTHNCLIVFCVEARCQHWMLFFRFHLLWFFLGSSLGFRPSELG